LNDLLRHELQQASAAEEGEAAVSRAVAHGLASRIIKNFFFQKGEVEH